jgi:hypothetical protein
MSDKNTGDHIADVWTTRDAVNEITINIAYPSGSFQVSDTGEVIATNSPPRATSPQSSDPTRRQP